MFPVLPGLEPPAHALAEIGHVSFLLVILVLPAGSHETRRLRGEHQAIRILFLIHHILKPALAVIIADDIHDVTVASIVPAMVHGCGRLPGRIEGMGEGDQFLKQPGAHPCPFKILLVLETPHKDRRVVAVAEYEGPQVFDTVVANPEVAVLVEDEHSDAVTGIQKLRSRRVVGGTVTIAPHILEQTDPVALHLVRQGHSKTGMVLMVRRALHGIKLSVKIETIRPDFNGSYAERRIVSVHDSPVTYHFGFQAVKAGSLGRPQVR